MKKDFGFFNELADLLRKYDFCRMSATCIMVDKRKSHFYGVALHSGNTLSKKAPGKASSKKASKKVAQR